MSEDIFFCAHRIRTAKNGLEMPPKVIAKIAFERQLSKELKLTNRSGNNWDSEN